MRRRFFALGYVFFVLLTVTGLIMTFSFIERITNSGIVDVDKMIDKALSDTASIQADPAYVIENVNHDLAASLKNFHFYPEVSFIQKEHRSNCLSCHTPLPHNKDIKTRAFLNMHGGFIACQTCHSDGKKGDYKWYDMERNKVAEALISDAPLMSIQLTKMVSGKATVTKQNAPEFLSVLSDNVKNDPGKADALCETTYRGDLTKALSCMNCHVSDKSVLDWKALGYPPQRQEQLMTLSIPNVFNKYDEFYIPSF